MTSVSFFFLLSILIQCFCISEFGRFIVEAKIAAVFLFVIDEVKSRDFYRGFLSKGKELFLLDRDLKRKYSGFEKKK